MFPVLKRQEGLDHGLTLNNIKVQREILANTTIKKDGKVIKKGSDKVREKAGRIFANHEQPSHEPGDKEYKTYFQYYQSVYIETWDKDHAKK